MSSLQQFFKLINYEESVSVWNIVSKCLTVEKQVGKAYFHLPSDAEPLLNILVPKKQKCSIKEVNCQQFQLMSSPLSLSLCPLLSVMEVCPPNRSFSCKDPSWAERGGNLRYTTSHSSLYILANLLQSFRHLLTIYPRSTSPFVTSNSTAVFVLRSQTHTALDQCKPLCLRYQEFFTCLEKQGW